MKNLLLMFALMVSQILSSQTTIYSENFGTVTSNTSVSSFNGWQNSSPITYTGNVDVRRTQPSSPTPNDDNANVFFTNSTPRSFTISGINTSTYSEVFLTLNHFKSTIAGNNELLIQVSSDGINYTTLSYSRPTGGGTAIWRLISPSGTIPITNNLRIRFTQTSTSTQFRIDDITLTSPVSLPVELTYFDGVKQDGFNLLKWQTASEFNSSHFIIEKTTTGDFKNSTIVGNILGSGYSQNIIDYDLLDMKVENVINYYRLIQYDFDGKTKVYPIIAIDNRHQKEVEKIVDLSGKEVNEYYKGIVIIYYKNGEFVKTYQY
jgi:hypothetical protein